MSMFTHAITCLTTSNLPWFMDLTFLVSVQYCSLQYQTLLPSLVTPTTGYCFCFGSASSFFLELFFHWSPVAHWAPTDLGNTSSLCYLSPFSYCSVGSQGKNTEVVCHSLLQWTTFCQKHGSDHFFLLLSSNPVILKCKWWEWVWRNFHKLEAFFWFIVITNEKVYHSLAHD